MKLARFNNLTRLDSSFHGGEPEDHYQKRRRIVVDDNYDFVANDATDVTLDLDEVIDYGFLSATDYLQGRHLFQQALNDLTWANATNDQRDLCIYYYLKEDSVDDATDGVNKVTHLITTGQAADAGEARAKIIKEWSCHHLREKEVASARLYSERLYEVLGSYLSIADASDLFMSVESLFLSYETQVIRGTQDGSHVAGLFDYLESTDIYALAGLAAKGYIMQNGDPDETNFVIDLMDVLRYGKY